MNSLQRFRYVLPAAGTFSKDPRCFVGEDENDLFAVYGNGATVTLGKNREQYLDWICALGANILGYGNEEWMSAMTRAVALGASFSIPTCLEIETAELLVDTVSKYVPGWKDKQLQVRFVKTGSECTEAAVRLARAVTGRKLISRCSDSYLGWGDIMIATTPPAHGIPETYSFDTLLFRYGQEPEAFARTNPNILNIDTYLSKSACVILEQGLQDPPEGWYTRLRKWCDEQGALLILDETASGFRYGLGGAAEHFNILPDLVCYGKALGNGVAIAALVGPKEYMDWFAHTDPVFVSGTFCGETLGLAGAKTTLEFMLSHDVIGHLREIGQALKEGLISALVDTPVKVVGHDVRHILQWPSDEWHAYIVRGMLENQILLNRPNYNTWAHTLEDVKLTVSTMGMLVDKWKKNGLPGYTPEQLPRVLFRGR